MKTPKDHLLEDLLGAVEPAQDTSLLPRLAPEAESLQDAANERFRGLVFMTAVGTDGQAYAAVRSTPGMDEALDFTSMVGAALDRGVKPRSVEELLALPSSQQRIDNEFPGLVLVDEPDAEGRPREMRDMVTTLHARGDAAVVQFFRLVQAACEHTPVPDWKAKHDKTEFLLMVYKAYDEGRPEDAADLIRAFAESHDMDVPDDL